MRRNTVISLSGVLIWCLMSTPTNGVDNPYTVIELHGDGFGDANFRHTAALTRIRQAGDIFWWFHQTEASTPTERPIILWLDGVTGIPPSLMANFAAFGPFDFDLNRRNGSWIDNYNLLFVDSPIGTGFSTPESDQIPGDLETSTQHLIYTLESFYNNHEEFLQAPLYIFGQSHGAQLAVSLAVKLSEVENFTANFRWIGIGGGIISPNLALSHLGNYLEQMGYVDGDGRVPIEALSQDVNNLIEQGRMAEAFDRFLTLQDVVNEEAGAVAVNLEHLIHKLENTGSRGDFGQRQYLQNMFRTDLNNFMNQQVAPALGIQSPAFDSRRDDVLQAFRESFMIPVVDKVEYILQNTNLTVTIYNGNLDAVSTIPGQLEWVNNLVWDGQTEFLGSQRRSFVINNVIEGYVKETSRLQFYWVHVAGLSAPLDNPVAMRRIVERLVV